MVVDFQQIRVQKLEQEMDCLLWAMAHDETIVQSKTYKSVQCVEERFDEVVSELMDLGVDLEK